ncbi:MAG: hypothetical protein R3F15_08815 [Lysobacterales bacterium]
MLPNDIVQLSGDRQSLGSGSGIRLLRQFLHQQVQVFEALRVSPGETESIDDGAPAPEPDCRIRRVLYQCLQPVDRKGMISLIGCLPTSKVLDSLPLVGAELRCTLRKRVQFGDEGREIDSLQFLQTSEPVVGAVGSLSRQHANEQQHQSRSKAPMQPRFGNGSDHRSYLSGSSTIF